MNGTCPKCERLFIKTDDETGYGWCVKCGWETEPCINCGQTIGQKYIGQPHDHVCADCWRELPYREAYTTEEDIYNELKRIR